VTQALISAFARLEQKVIMRFDSKFVKNVPENVMIVNWVPQQDVLGLEISCCRQNQENYMYMIFSLF
jgi:hypothetical protein